MDDMEVNYVYTSLLLIRSELDTHNGTLINLHERVWQFALRI